MFDDNKKLIISDFDKANGFANKLKKSFTIANEILSNYPVTYIASFTWSTWFLPHTIDTYLLKSNS